MGVVCVLSKKMAEPEAEAENSITVALFQGYAEAGDVRRNVDTMKGRMREAKELGADVIVFPELFASDYYLTHDQMRQLAQASSGSIFLELSEHARETGIGVLYGYPELDNSKIYNSVQFIDKSGKSLANYRKTHLWLIDPSDNTEEVFEPGDDLSNVFEFCGVKIGLLICFDVEFSEAVRVLALRGADLVLVPTAVSTKFDISIISDVVVPSRAFENGVYVAYVNHSGGPQFAGASRCYGPTGEALISCGSEEGIFLTEVKALHEKSCYLTKRRPELYRVAMQ